MSNRPVTKQSGSYNTSSHISNRGNSIIRHALYLSTIPAIRYNPVVKRYYYRKKEAEVGGNKLIRACSNKF